MCLCSTSDGGVDGGDDGGLDLDAGADAEVLDAQTPDAGPEGHVFPPRDFVCAPETSPPCETTTPALSEAERTMVLTSEDSSTLTFVVSSLRIPESNGGRAAGFNLDGWDDGSGNEEGASCDRFSADFRSTSGGRVGIDNAFSGLISTFEGLLDVDGCPGMEGRGCIDAAIQAAINDGSFLLLLEVSDVDDPTNDDDVGVTLHAAELEGGGAPEVDGTARLVSGQRFQVLATRAETTRGDIFQSVVRVGWSSVQLMPPTLTAGARIPASLDDVELRITLGGGAASGEVGGVRTIDAALVGELGDSEIASTVELVLQSVADLSPSSGDAAVCEAISIGLELDAVGAVRVP